MRSTLLAWILAIAAPPDSFERLDLSSLPVGEPVPLVVDRDGTCQIDLPPGQFTVVVGSLARGDRLAKVQVSVSDVEQREPVRVAETTPSEEWLARANELRQRMRDRRALVQRDGQVHAAARFAERRGFYLFVGDADLHDVSNYREIQARLVAVGKHCIVYVDEGDKPDRFDRRVIDEVVSTFDNVAFPIGEERYGQRRDVDRNGKFTILITSWLGRLSGDKVSVGGFVRGGDFHVDVPAPFGNQCDMMYLNSNIAPGDHLRALIAHEYTHAITFSEHCFGGYLPERIGEDEESWLSEALAHLAENYAEAGWSNLDYRVSAYLNDTGRYRLVVPDYYRAGLWRCHGSRGATYLFLRWLVDQFGDDVINELNQSSLSGEENIEVATQTPFAELFRAWSVSLACAGNANETDELRYLSLQGRLDTRLLIGAIGQTVEPGQSTVTVSPTSFAALRTRTPSEANRRIRLTAPAHAKLQVTVSRTPGDAPVATLRAVGETPDKVRLSLVHRSGSPVTWSELSWERRVLPQTKEAGPAPSVVIHAASEIFSQAKTLAGETNQGDPLDLTEYAGKEVVFKLLGTDSAGRRAVAWARFVVPTLDPSSLAVSK